MRKHNSIYGNKSAKNREHLELVVGLAHVLLLLSFHATCSAIILQVFTFGQMRRLFFQSLFISSGHRCRVDCSVRFGPFRPGIFSLRYEGIVVRNVAYRWATERLTFVSIGTKPIINCGTLSWSLLFESGLFVLVVEVIVNCYSGFGLLLEECIS